MFETPISAKIVADSISETDCRLTTMITTYPRFVHAEHLRHRMFSFTVASSRAIPPKKFHSLVKDTPCLPVWWGKNEPGMQANWELEGDELKSVKVIWEEAKESMLAFHDRLMAHNLHKQIANRVLEAWMPVTVLFTGTDWKNFFKLRCHKDAQPEMQAVADCCLKAYVESEPELLKSDGWHLHLPFITKEEKSNQTLETNKQVSVSRCARLSYFNFSGTSDLEKDVDLHNRLAKNGHWSPFEHIARPDGERIPKRWANFNGWFSYRQSFLLENPERMPLDLNALLQERRALGSKYAL